ncbi:hypothetical protein [Caenimonas aquaedulcis]|uniref:DUF3405 domain-containing protein n=1 Tax=Caenimonas aquaedulcis TaxID=2793270 RepID=A0A931H2N1_9BURK|nr:hypothetical protein [Caenimonas aquaedulcis]MBG9387446.1 hypothetical protein [Caenimonas aquaedulcis]
MALPDTAVVFLAHQWGEAIGQRFLRLRRELGAFADCFVLLHDDQGPVRQQWTAFLQSRDLAGALVPFDDRKLPGDLGWGYFGRSHILANTHFPLMWFARGKPYAWYWQVESDVEYRGHWQAFMSAYRENPAPLLVTHIHRHGEWPTWTWWRSLTVPVEVELKDDALYKGFFPVFRISRPALDAVEGAHRRGWSGHFEVLIPTLLVRQGFTIQDLRATLPCYVGQSQNPCPILPIQATMRWRPPISRGEFMHRGNGPLLFHPVKENWSFDGGKVVQWEGPAPLEARD